MKKEHFKPMIRPIKPALNQSLKGLYKCSCVHVTRKNRLFKEFI